MSTDKPCCKCWGDLKSLRGELMWGWLWVWRLGIARDSWWLLHGEVQTWTPRDGSLALSVVENEKEVHLWRTSHPGQSLCALCGMPLARGAVSLSLLLYCKDLGHMLSLDLVLWAWQLLPRDLLERQHRDAFAHCLRDSISTIFPNIPCSSFHSPRTLPPSWLLVAWKRFAIIDTT